MMALVGCDNQITKQEFAPKMYSQRPLSILVLPPINKSTAADAKEYYTTTIAEPLTNCGYYVYPIEIINDLLKQEGLFDTETMMNVPPQKFKEYFGADAVLFVTIIEWNTSYLVTSGSVTVKLTCELRSTATADVLWFYDDTVTVDTSVDKGGSSSFLTKAVLTAIKTAFTDYIPIARKANENILMAIPYGKYHKKYDTDSKMKINKKTNPNKKE